MEIGPFPIISPQATKADPLIHTASEIACPNARGFCAQHIEEVYDTGRALYAAKYQCQRTKKAGRSMQSVYSAISIDIYRRRKVLLDFKELATSVSLS